MTSTELIQQRVDDLIQQRAKECRRLGLRRRVPKQFPIAAIDICALQGMVVMDARVRPREQGPDFPLQATQEIGATHCPIAGYTARRGRKRASMKYCGQLKEPH